MTDYTPNESQADRLVAVIEQVGGPVNISVTHDAAARLDQLAQTNGALRLVAILDCRTARGAKRVQDALHAAFAHQKHIQNWYDVTPAQVAQLLNAARVLAQHVEDITFHSLGDDPISDVALAADMLGSFEARLHVDRLAVASYLERTPEALNLPADELARIVGVTVEAAQNVQLVWKAALESGSQ